jgi:hypothetical protein
VKHGVRYLRRDAAADNTFGIDESKIVLYGQGSGGYVSQAYTTLDNPSVELFLEKFRPDPFDATVSYVDTLTVGNPEGLDGQLTLYQNPDNMTSEVHMSVNAGGALADESWLEAGDVPMVAFHAVRDDFAPFTEGTVIVPTTNEPVVDVMGSNFFIQKANDLGNNDVFASIPSGDVYTDAARALYGTSHEVSFGETETVNTAEGLYPIVLPLAAYLSNQASPWEWWDPMSPLATTVVGMIGDTPITAHMASLGSNPDMSEAKGLSYLDTIQGYLLPRVMCALDLEGAACSTEDSVNEIKENNSLVVYPNPASDVVFLEAKENILSVAVYNVAGKLVASLEGKSGNRLEVSMTDYTPGYYSFQVRTASGISTERVIKK